MQLKLPKYEAKVMQQPIQLLFSDNLLRGRTYTQTEVQMYYTYCFLCKTIRCLLYSVVKINIMLYKAQLFNRVYRNLQLINELKLFKKNAYKCFFKYFIL